MEIESDVIEGDVATVRSMSVAHSTQDLNALNIQGRDMTKQSIAANDNKIQREGPGVHADDPKHLPSSGGHTRSRVYRCGQAPREDVDRATRTSQDVRPHGATRLSISRLARNGTNDGLL
jgi:hypothetical protein